MARSMAATLVRSTAIRRAAVAWSPSEPTWRTMSSPRQAANAPYSLGPMTRAAIMVKP